jgi:hypothetical protein
MRWLWTIPLLLASSLGFATNAVFLAPSAAGGNTGVDCADAKAATTYFNTSGNWSATPTGIQIGPATTVHFCGGTYSASAGTSNYFTFQGSGSSGNPITTVCDAAATFTATYWSGDVFNLAGQSFLTLNGTNCTIQATANGTSLANQQDNGCGICSGSNVSNVTIENWTISNLYVHVCSGPSPTITNPCPTINDTTGGGNTSAISIWEGSNDTIAFNTITNVHWGIVNIYGGSASNSTNIQTHHNTVSGMDHGVILGDQGSNSTLTSSNCSSAIHDNDFSNTQSWDAYGGGAFTYHHDGYHSWANNTPTSSYQGVCFYNNYAHGDWGFGPSGMLTNESLGNANYIFNNLIGNLINNSTCADGALTHFTGTGSNGTGNVYANNTVDPGSTPCNKDVGMTQATTTTFESNLLLSNSTTYIYAPTTSTFTTADYNYYQTPVGSTGFYCNGTNGSFSVWTTCGNDAHGHNASVTVNATTYTLPSGSAAIGAGTTPSGMPTAYFTGAPLTFGATGSCGSGGCATRPGSGAQDVGAYPFASSSNYTITVSTITGNGLVTSSDSGLSCGTGGSTPPCSDMTATGTVTLTFTASGGYTLSSVTGCTLSGITCSVTATTTITATFTATSNATSYANASTGNDSYNCSSATFTSGFAGPCLTVNRAALNTAANGTINIAAGTYRLSTALSSTAGYITPNTGQTFTGPACTPTSAACTAIISGSVQFTSGQIQGPDSFGNYFVTGQTQQGTATVSNTNCDTGWSGCILPEDLFVNGTPYQHLNLTTEATLAASTWWFNYNTQTIYLPSALTPTFVGANTVETSVLETMFNPNGVNGVTVENLTIEEFAAPISRGAIDPSFATPVSTSSLNWIIQNDYITLNHGIGVRCAFGEQVLNNVITANGNLGAGGGCLTTNAVISSGVVLQGNTITLNNYAQVNPGYQGGGVKYGNTANVVARGNTISHNIGQGLHFDTNSINPLVDGNTVTYNVDLVSEQGLGIEMEISNQGISGGNAVIRNNLIQYNGESATSGPNYQLQSTDSNLVQAYCNVIEGDNSSATMQQWTVSASSRGNNTNAPGVGNYLTSTGNYIHHNTVIWDTGATGTVGYLQNDATNQPNFFSLNTAPNFNLYHASSTGLTKFIYDNNNSGANTPKTFASYQSSGADVSGTIDTTYTSGFPTVKVTSPADQSSFSGTLSLGATASDTSGIASASVYVDWVLQSTTSGAGPYTFSLPSITNGPHTLAVYATANSGVKSCNAVTLTQTLGPPTGLTATPGVTALRGVLFIP